MNVEPCGCGGGVRIMVEGAPMTADDVQTLLVGTLAQAAGLDSVEKAVTELTFTEVR